MGHSLSVIILTRDEELHLPACLESLRGLDCEVFVVDSGSTDRTAEVAREAGARVVGHEFETQAQQLNWALDSLPLAGDWVFRLDADERATPELVGELHSLLPALGPDVTGLYVKRRVYFLGRWMRHGGYYPIWLLRLWRRGCARSEGRLMDEHMVLVRGRASYLRHDIAEWNLKGLAAWVERQNRYSSREAMSLMAGPGEGDIPPRLFGTPEARRRWLKHKVLLRFPPFVRAFLYFLFRYFVRLGFLDGRPGLVFHFLHGFWYRFLIDAKLYEARLRAERAESRGEADRLPARGARFEGEDR